jgi:hypothetical protein
MMRDLLISEFQDGHTVIRLMLMSALGAASWFTLRQPPRDQPTG